MFRKVILFITFVVITMSMLFGIDIPFDCKKDLASFSRYSYPYHELPEILAKEGKNSLLLFSYGSLMDENSAAETLSSQALKTRIPALGFGVKRVFNLDVPVTPNSKFGKPHDPKARAMLNIEQTGNNDDFINGVLIDIPASDLPSLLEREKGYDLIPIIVTEWSDFEKAKPQYKIAYALESQNINPFLYPRPGYYELSRDAAFQFSPVFGLIWQETTYLADGKTRVAKWEKWLKEHRACTYANES